METVNNPEKRRKLFRWFKDNTAKIVFMQETFCTKEFSKLENNAWPGKIYHNLSHSPHSKGVAIMFSNSLDYKVHNVHKMEDSRVILINCTVDNQDITLVNVYAPTDKPYRVDFFKKLKFWVARHADNPNDIYMGGDFNCALNDNDRLNTAGNTDKSRTELNKLLKDLDLIDSWYEKHDKPQYTFTDITNGSKSRIDYFFISNNIRHKLVEIKLQKAPKKDKHKAVCPIFKFENNKKGPGYWKLNSKLMDTDEFQVLIRELLDEIRYNYNHFDSRSKWEMFKILLRDASIKLGVKRAKQQRYYIKNIQTELDNLNAKEDLGEHIDQAKRDELSLKLDNYYKEKDDGYIIRSKLKWKNEGERSTKFFFNLEKAQQSSNVIRRLKDNHGNFLTDDSDILEHTCDFYKKLFSSKRISQTDIDTYLDNTPFDKKLTHAEKQMCGEKITSKELDTVIKNLKLGKSPGCDGITTEFYKKFWHLIKIPFMEMLNETFEHGELPYTMRKALLALLYKKVMIPYLKITDQYL